MGLKKIIILSIILNLFISVSLGSVIYLYSSSHILYVLQAGAYSNKENADATMEKIKLLEHDCFMYEYKSLYYVVTKITYDQEEIIEEETFFKEKNLNYAIRKYYFLIPIKDKEKILKVLSNEY